MQRKSSDYLSLFLISLAFIAATYHYQTVAKYVLLLSSSYGVIYVIWGIYHEYRARNLRFIIVLEYLLVAMLGVAIVSTLLL